MRCPRTDSVGHRVHVVASGGCLCKDQADRVRTDRRDGFGEKGGLSCRGEDIYTLAAVRALPEDYDKASD